MYMQNPAWIYTRCVSSEENGTALWVPEPNANLPLDCRLVGTQIGDVGYVDQRGAFIYLFNITRDAEDPVNIGRVPDGFIHLDRPVVISRIENFHPPGAVIGSSSFRAINGTADLSWKGKCAGASVTCSFESRAKEGGLLVLPDGADSEDLMNYTSFVDYALEHAPTWYHHANTVLGLDIGFDSLYLITGCDKAEAWALTAHSGTEGQTSISLNLSVPSIRGGGASYSYRWENQQPIQGRVSSNTLGVKNQCVFVRGFSVSVNKSRSSFRSLTVKVDTGAKRFLARPKFKGAKKEIGGPFFRLLGRFNPHQNSTAQNGQSRSSDIPASSVTIEPFSRRLQYYNPAVVINKYLLQQNPETRVVITHDSNCYAVLREGDNLPLADLELIRRVLNQSALVFNTDGISLSPRAGRNRPVGFPLLLTTSEEKNQDEIKDQDDDTSFIASELEQRYNGHCDGSQMESVNLSYKAPELLSPDGATDGVVPPTTVMDVFSIATTTNTMYSIKNYNLKCINRHANLQKPDNTDPSQWSHDNINIFNLPKPPTVFALLHPHIATEALYNSREREKEHASTCLPEIRTKILQRIRQWVDGEGHSVCWMHGPAGTGKSTIAHTIAEEYSDKGLAATFFFARGKGGRDDFSKLIPTLAYQIAQNISSTEPMIQEVLEKDGTILHKTLRDQFSALIIGPMTKVKLAKNSLVVLDGLDECASRDDILKLISLLGEKIETSGHSIRLLLTSRPEPNINTVRPYHASLRDFLTSHERSQHLFCPPSECHGMLLIQCLRTITSACAKNDRLLEYACTAWVHHRSLMLSDRNARQLDRSLLHCAEAELEQIDLTWVECWMAEALVWVKPDRLQVNLPLMVITSACARFDRLLRYVCEDLKTANVFVLPDLGFYGGYTICLPHDWRYSAPELFDILGDVSITPDGRAKLIDVGIDHLPLAISQIRILESWQYKAPEELLLLDCAKDGVVVHTTATDVFSLATTHYAILGSLCMDPSLRLNMKYLSVSKIVNRMSILTGVAAGLLYLHEQSVIHGNLKPGNVLIDHNGQAKLFDFGCSKIMGHAGYTAGLPQVWRYGAPELLMKDEMDESEMPRFTQESDVYSFGMVALEILTGKAPFYYLSDPFTLVKASDLSIDV